jgi:choline dehydrogenase/5-(hydroxymethyl)furfural/furfural oxidase
VTRWLVVGAGAAGCVVASRLSEDEANEVTLVEAGRDHGGDPVPGDVGPFLADPARLWPGSAVVRRAGGAPEPYHQGLGLGGSSLVNGAVVEHVEARVDADVDHLVPIEEPDLLGPVGAALVAASSDARPVLLSRRGGVRVTAADAYLRPFAGRPNLTIVTDTPVHRLLLDGRRVGGVVTAGGDELGADRVVVCAGAIRTPTILLRSGVDTPGLGEGLQDHPAFSIALELEPRAVDAGVATITASVVRPAHRIMAMNHLPGLPGFGALVAGLMDVTSTGRVSLPDPDGQPIVELRALSDPADVEGLTDVVLDALDLLDHPAMGAVVRSAFVDDHGTAASTLLGDEAAVRTWLPTHLSGFHHVAASCRMGTVTDDAGAVRGHEALYVCDASVFPGVPKVNPYLSVIALAERLVARWRRIDRSA